jgi:hypothetical protein
MWKELANSTHFVNADVTAIDTCPHILDRNEENVARWPQSRLHGAQILAYISECFAGTNWSEGNGGKKCTLKSLSGLSRTCLQGSLNYTWEWHWGKKGVIEISPLLSVEMWKRMRCMNQLATCVVNLRTARPGQVAERSITDLNVSRTIKHTAHHTVLCGEFFNHCYTLLKSPAHTVLSTKYNDVNYL